MEASNANRVNRGYLRVIRDSAGDLGPAASVAPYRRGEDLRRDLMAV
jgi:hypothetical protein